MLGTKKETDTHQVNSLIYTQGHSIPYADLCKWLTCHELTQEKLGFLTGRTPPTVRKYTKNGLWTVSDIALIAKTLGLPFEEVACRFAKIEPVSVPMEEFQTNVDKVVYEKLKKAIATLEEECK